MKVDPRWHGTKSKKLMRSVDIMLVIAAFMLSAGITGLMKVYAQRANLLDVPNQRSSHQVATPRGGGLSIVVVFLGAVIGLYIFGNLPTDVFSSLLVGGVLVAGIGFVDDHRHVPAKWRFLVQIIAATFAVAMLGGLPEIQLGDKLVDLGHGWRRDGDRLHGLAYQSLQFHGRH